MNFLEVGAISGATLAIHLSIRNLGYIERALTPHNGADCPVVVAYRITWPDQMIIRGKRAEWAHHDPQPCLMPPDWSGGYTSIFALQQKEERAAA